MTGKSTLQAGYVQVVHPQVPLLFAFFCNYAKQFQSFAVLQTILTRNTLISRRFFWNELCFLILKRIITEEERFMRMTPKKHVRGDRSSCATLSHRKERGLRRPVRMLGSICPFTLEPRENCSTRITPFKRVCSFTLEACCN